MSSHSPVAARHHVQAIGRLLGLFCTVLLLVAVSFAATLPGGAHPSASWGTGELSLSLSMAVQRERLEAAVERLRTGQPALR